MKMIQTLKNCPFCDGIAYVGATAEAGTFMEVEHNKGCAIEHEDQPCLSFDDMGQAMAAWNARNDSPVDEESLRLKVELLLDREHTVTNGYKAAHIVKLLQSYLRVPMRESDIEAAKWRQAVVRDASTLVKQEIEIRKLRKMVCYMQRNPSFDFDAALATISLTEDGDGKI